MSQHRDPLERDPNQPPSQADPALDGATSIGDDAGVFADQRTARERDRSDAANNGLDPLRSRAVEAAAIDENLDPPPADFRPDSIVRGVSPQARQTMQSGNTDFGNEATFTKGQNAPTTDQSRGNYTVEQMDQYLTGSREGLFPDTPGGAGATPLSADRHTFIGEVTNLGHFPSRQEAEKWTRAVFNALRHHAYEADDRALMDELKQAVRFGESPEVQVEEMMWGGDFVDRFSRMTTLLQSWSKAEFYKQIAEEAGETADDPWVDAAVHSFFGALKRTLGDDADRTVGQLGELQDVWQRA